VNVDLDAVVTNVVSGGGRVRTVSVQFPDPHFKNSQKKRRVVTEEFVEGLGRRMREGGVGDERVWLQSDIKDVLDDMREVFRESRHFVDTEGEGEYVKDNWMGIKTEREISVENKGLPVWRALFKVAEGSA